MNETCYTYISRLNTLVLHSRFECLDQFRCQLLSDRSNVAKDSWYTLQHTATHCYKLQHTAAHCNTLQLIATLCSSLQHAAAHCNTLQHTATLCSSLQFHLDGLPRVISETLQHTATHCNTLQHPADLDGLQRVISAFC